MLFPAPRGVTLAAVRDALSGTFVALLEARQRHCPSKATEQHSRCVSDVGQAKHLVNVSIVIDVYVHFDDLARSRSAENHTK